MSPHPRSPSKNPRPRLRTTPSGRVHDVGLITAAVLSLAGCTAGPPDQVGVRIGDETLKQFKAGVTTEDWLVAVLGPPNSVSDVVGVAGTRVLRYSTAEASSGLTAWITGRASRNTSVTYFIVTDGVVTRFWADRELQPTLLGKPVETPTGVKER